MAGLSRRIAIVAAVVLCLGAAACSTHKVAGSGGLSGGSVPAGSPAPGSSFGPTPSVLPGGAPGTGTTDGATSAGGNTSTTHTGTPHPAHSSASPPPAGPLEVKVVVAQIGSIVTTSCPGPAIVQAVISVSKGPIDIHYEWVHGDGTAFMNLVAEFPGTGPQTRTVTDTYDFVSAAPTTYTDTIVILGQDYDASHNFVKYTVTCAPLITISKLSLSPHGLCPSVPTFHATLDAYGPAVISYQWHFSDGTKGVTQFVPLAAGYHSTDISTSNKQVVAPSLDAWVVITSVNGSTSRRITFTCDKANQ